MNKVILIEDEQIIRKSLALTVPWADYGCVLCADAGTGEEGLSLIRSIEPDIVITDIHLPGISGIEMLEKGKLISDFESVIITGYNQFDYASKAIDLSVTGYILKPIDENRLGQIMRKASEKASEKRRNRTDDRLSIDILIENCKNPQVLKVLRILRSNYVKHLSLDSLGKEIGLSCGYLSREFKKETGRTFLEVQQRLRIETAIRLMKEKPHLKNYQVAEMTGFSSYKRFVSVFREICGYTPNEMKSNEKENI